MHYYPTRKSLNSPIEIIENADRLLGGSMKVTDTHKVFSSILVPVLIGAAAAAAAVVCLWIFVHPLAGAAAAFVFAYLAKRIRDKRIHMQRMIVHCRAIEKKSEIEYVLNDEQTGRLKEQYEASLAGSDPGERKKQLSEAYNDLEYIIPLLAKDI